MERDFPMMRSLLALSFCLLWSQAALPAGLIKKPDMVLVASIKSTAGPLSVEEVRKLYLGATLLDNGQIIRPLLNYSDGYLQELFMQKVMLMSTPHYEHHILSRVFRMGGNRPKVHTGLHKLVGALKADPNTVTYMYSDEAGAHPDLKVLSILWKDQD